MNDYPTDEDDYPTDEDDYPVRVNAFGQRLRDDAEWLPGDHYGGNDGSADS